MSKKNPFRPATVDVKLTLGGKSEWLPVFNGVANADYGGQPLYLHAFSDGTRLSLVIDDVPEVVQESDAFGGHFVEAVPAAPGGTQVTFVFNGKVLNNWQSTLPYDGKRGLTFTATVDPSMTNMHFFIEESTLASTRSAKDGIVSFLLFQPPGTADYEIHWFRSDHVVIPYADQIDGSVVLRSDPPPQAGGVTGPMGFSSP